MARSSKPTAITILVTPARDNLTNTASKLIRNEFGGTVGGPIWIPKIYNGKNRTFCFFAFEGYKQRTGPSGLFRVPTEAMRNGDFSRPGGLRRHSVPRSTIRLPPIRPTTSASSSTTAAS